MKLHLSNATHRDATIIATSLPASAGAIPSKGGKPVMFKRYVAAGEGKLHDAMANELGENYAKELVEADPEIDLEMVGRLIDDTSTVLVNKNSEPLYCAPEILEIIYGPDGACRGIWNREIEGHVDSAGDTILDHEGYELLRPDTREQWMWSRLQEQLV